MLHVGCAPVSSIRGHEGSRRPGSVAQLDAPSVDAVAVVVVAVEGVAPWLVPVLRGYLEHGRVRVLVLVPVQRMMTPHRRLPQQHPTPSTTEAAAGVATGGAGCGHEEGGVVDGHAAESAQTPHATASVAVRVACNSSRTRTRQGTTG